MVPFNDAAERNSFIELAQLLAAIERPFWHERLDALYRSGTPLMAKDDDSDDDDSDDDDSEDDDVDKAAKSAARRAKAGRKAKEDSDDDDDDDDDDNLASDEDTAEWINQVVKVPEIQDVIRRAAQAIAKEDSVKATMKDIRKTIDEDLEDRLSEIRDELEEGNITRAQADKKAKRAARDAAKNAKDSVDDDDDDSSNDDDRPSDADKERRRRIDARNKERDERRERRLRTRELQAYARESLADEDSRTLVKAMVRITDDTEDEQDVDDMIEKAKAEYKRIRKDVMKTLKAQGWRSPKDLEASNGSSDEDDDDEDIDPTGPPAKSKKRNGELSDKRKEELQHRFKYGKGGQIRGRPRTTA